MTDTGPTPSRPRWPATALAVLAVLGVVDAILLTRIHVLIHAQPDFKSFCDISAKVSCDDVLATTYAEIFKAPVSLFALVSYLLLLGLAVQDLRARDSGTAGAAHRIFLLTLFNFLFSLYLGIISMVEIGVVCPLCAGLYAVAVLALAAAWKNLPAGPAGFLDGLSGEVNALLSGPKSRWAFEGGAAALALALVVAFNVASPFSKPPAKGAQPHPGEIARNGTGGVEAVPTDPAAKRAFFKNKVRQWLETLPGCAADPGPYEPKGTAGAPVQVVEFADFQCPACKNAWAGMGEIIKMHPGKVALHYRNFPLSKDCNKSMQSAMHTEACNDALAAHCAHEQGNFWVYADRLFDQQTEQSQSKLEPWAKELGLDGARFRSCLAAKTGLQQIERDVDDALAMKIESTPTLCMNGKRLKGFPGIDVMDLAVEILTEDK